MNIKFNDTEDGVREIVARIYSHLYFDHNLPKKSVDTKQILQNLKAYRRYVFAFAVPSTPPSLEKKTQDEDEVLLGWKHFGAVGKNELSWLQQEYRRQGMISKESTKFREFLNQKLSLVSTYPKHFILPSEKWFPDHELFQAFEFRSKKRLPVVTFMDPKQGTRFLLSLSISHSLTHSENRPRYRHATLLTTSCGSERKTRRRGREVDRSVTTARNKSKDVRSQCYAYDCGLSCSHRSESESCTWWWC